ncbi:MAG: hypothetical protein LC792_01850 [Actinobacteria bacterium]|nr:hypothetical protein [Actinomycetota bacterium]
MRRRLTTALLASVLGAAVLAPGAVADPSQSPNAATVQATCDGQALTLVFIIRGNGEWAPDHVLGSTSELIPQAFDLSIEITTESGDTFSHMAASTRPHPHGNLVTCSLDSTQPISGGTLHISGTVTGYFTPARQSE